MTPMWLEKGSKMAQICPKMAQIQLTVTPKWLKLFQNGPKKIESAPK